MQVCQNAKASFLHVFLCGLPLKCGPDLGWIFSPQMMQSGSALQGCPAFWVLVVYRYNQVDNQD